MKKNRILIIALLMIIPFVTFSQSKKTKEMLKEIENQWTVDENGNVTYQLIVEAKDLGKDEIYNRAESYFIYNYGSGKSVIQSQDKKLGRLIAKGLYSKVHIAGVLAISSFDFWHIVRVDVKDGRARIILTLTEIEKTVSGGSGLPSTHKFSLSGLFPFNKKSMTKNHDGQAFYKAHLRAQLTLKAIEKAIKEGNTSEAIENDDW